MKMNDDIKDNGFYLQKCEKRERGNEKGKKILSFISSLVGSCEREKECFQYF